MPVVVENFPESSNAAAAWSLDGNGGLLICTSFSMIHEAQKFLLPYFKKDHPDPNGWRSSFASMGLRTRSRALQDAAASMTSTKRGLAGNTQLGEEDAKKHRSQIRKDVSDAAGEPPEDTQPVEFSSVLAHTRLTATVSTKLSYLIDSIVQHYAHEQIIVFYENENVAFYVATALDAVGRLKPLAPNFLADWFSSSKSQISFMRNRCALKDVPNM